MRLSFCVACGTTDDLSPLLRKACSTKAFPKQQESTGSRTTHFEAA